MSNDKTQEFDEPRSFEDRVFARFDSLDGRLGVVEIRITKLEERQYDTKPIWEQALSAILEVKTDVAELKTALAETNANVAKNTSDLARNTSDLPKNTEDLSTVKSELGELRKEMQVGFTAASHAMEHELRKVARMLDLINQNWFELKVDQRYLDRRLAILEEQNPT